MVLEILLGGIELKGSVNPCKNATYKEFKQTILYLFKQEKSARQLSLEYKIGYSILLNWVQGLKTISSSQFE